MKDKPNEWIAISDLMAGVMAVVMLLLVMAVLQKSYAELKHKQDMEGLAQLKDPSQQKLNQLLNALSTSLAGSAGREMVALDLSARKVTLRDGVFNRGSACLSTASQPALASLRQNLTIFLKDFPEGQIYVEGHTDDRPVARPVIDYATYCTVYDDNYTLSAARAREARKVLASDLHESETKRIVVAGFGDSQPLNGIPPADARQRRVEIRLVIPEGS